MNTLGTKTVYIVTIHSVNQRGQRGKMHYEVDTLTDVTRIILTYRPKNGYEVIEYKVDKEMRLAALV